MVTKLNETKENETEFFDIPILVRVRKVGSSGSLIVTIPKEYCELLNINEGDYIILKIGKIKMQRT